MVQIALLDRPGAAAGAAGVDLHMPFNHFGKRLFQGRPSHWNHGRRDRFSHERTASPSRKICTECPASDSARPCRKGSAALVGSSEPQALFIMMFSGLCVGSWPSEGTAQRNDSTII